jgi:hypothetical protein
MFSGEEWGDNETTLLYGVIGVVRLPRPRSDLARYFPAAAQRFINSMFCCNSGLALRPR